jgi:hypothetical protein
MKDNEREIGKIGKKIVEAVTSNKTVIAVSTATGLVGIVGIDLNAHNIEPWAASLLLTGASGLTCGRALRIEVNRYINRNRRS